MTIVRTFSRVFPSYHPKKNEPTFFVEKIYNSFDISWNKNGLLYTKLVELNPLRTPTELNRFWDSLNTSAEIQKHHTIRAGHHFKPGHKISPRVWSGAPYNSKQIIFSEDIVVEKVWNVEFEDESLSIASNMKGYRALIPIGDVAMNDGLEYDEFMDWFILSPEYKKKKRFVGQIICWSIAVNY